MDHDDRATGEEAGVPDRHPDQNLLRELEPAADLAVGQKPMLGTCVIRELVEARTRESAT
jgi:hypothetical protein